MKRTSSMTYRETDESKELELYTTNNGGLYRQMITPIINNLRKKYQRGTYDADKAVDLWYNVATEGAKLYNKEFGSDSQWSRLFNVQCRYTVAVNLESYYKEEVEYNA
nr:MAG TPA: hypothetical protein [Caudoviricetes sp.]